MPLKFSFFMNRSLLSFLITSFMIIGTSFIMTGDFKMIKKHPLITVLSFILLVKIFWEIIKYLFDRLDNKKDKILVYPNPFDNQTIIKVSSAQNTPLSLQLYDATGRMVQQLDSQNNQFELMRNDLPSGVYFYQIFSAQQPIGRGKLIAK